MTTYIDSACSCCDIDDGLTSITCMRKDSDEHEAGDILLFHVLVAVNGRFDCTCIKSRDGSFYEMKFADPIYYGGLEYYDYWRG